MKVGVKLQALVYDILPSRRKVPESGARSVSRSHTVGPRIAFSLFFLTHDFVVDNVERRELVNVYGYSAV